MADDEALQRWGTAEILATAQAAIRDRGQFHLVLAGGSTPRRIYRALRTAATDWNAWHIYFGDERCLPAHDPERNSTMAFDAWLSHVPIPRDQIHVIAGDLGATRAAGLYIESLRVLGEFDLVLLGLGEDGHTASLFPNHDWGISAQAPDMLAVFDAPKPPPERVSMSAARLSRARRVIFLVGGESKREALAAWHAGKNLPARAITPLAGVDIAFDGTLTDPARTAG